jgi:hypothetical protein
VGWLAPLENRAAMKELNNNNVEGNNPAAECCDVILEKRISRNKRGVGIDAV